MHAEKNLVSQKRYLEALCDIDLDLLLLCSLEHLPKHNVCNLLDFSLGQLSKHNDLIQPEIKAAASQPCQIDDKNTDCRKCAAQGQMLLQVSSLGAWQQPMPTSHMQALSDSYTVKYTPPGIHSYKHTVTQVSSPGITCLQS